MKLLDKILDFLFDDVHYNPVNILIHDGEGNSYTLDEVQTVFTKSQLMEQEITQLKNKCDELQELVNH